MTFMVLAQDRRLSPRGVERGQFPVGFSLGYFPAPGMECLVSELIPAEQQLLNPAPFEAVLG
jgi:hypothetical protein